MWTKQLENAIKTIETIWQNNQIILACHIKVYSYETTINKKSTILDLKPFQKVKIKQRKISIPVIAARHQNC